MPKQYDLMLLGATGFTGAQALRHLVGERAGQLERWAIAGRNRARLEALLAEIPGNCRSPDVVVADIDDAATVNAAVAATQVLVHLAGPYAPHGDAVVRSCVDHATHYLDLSGEPFFVQQLIRDHHAAAARQQVKIVPTCGYHALPFDIAALLAVRTLRERFDTPCAEVKIIVSFTGHGRMRPGEAFSGGTVASLKSMLALDESDCARNPACLVAAAPDAQEVRKRNAYNLDAYFDDDAKAYVAPAAPAPFIDPPVVLRSRYLLGQAGERYGDEFRYREGMSMASFTDFLPTQWVGAVAASATFRQFDWLLASRWKLQRDSVRTLLDTLGPRPGNGPSEAALDAWRYRLDVFARGESGACVTGRVDGKGHPGYRSTGAMIAEAGLALAYNADRLPELYGVVTPAAAFGVAILERLQTAGLTFDFTERRRARSKQPHFD